MRVEDVVARKIVRPHPEVRPWLRLELPAPSPEAILAEPGCARPAERSLGRRRACGSRRARRWRRVLGRVAHWRRAVQHPQTGQLPALRALRDDTRGPYATIRVALCSLHLQVYQNAVTRKASLWA